MSTPANRVGSIQALWRFPVKSMRGERLERADIEEDGIMGDRAYAVLDVNSDKLLTAKDTRNAPGMFQFRASFSELPRVGAPLPPVVIELPDGEQVSSASDDVDEVLSAALGRPVRLIAAGQGGPDSVEGDASFHDLYAVSVLSTSTLQQMNALQPGSIFDARRFRMNIIAETPEEGFPENAWVGQTLAVGDAVRIEVSQPDARCVMTTLAQEELPRDPAILSGLAKHNRLAVGGKGRYPCAGVYARVLGGGAVEIGDPVRVVEP